MKLFKPLCLIPIAFGTVHSISANEFKFDNIKYDHAEVVPHIIEPNWLTFVPLPVRPHQRHGRVTRGWHTGRIASCTRPPYLNVLPPGMPLVYRDLDVHIVAEQAVWWVRVCICVGETQKSAGPIILSRLQDSRTA